MYDRQRVSRRLAIDQAPMIRQSAGQSITPMAQMGLESSKRRWGWIRNRDIERGKRATVASDATLPTTVGETSPLPFQPAPDFSKRVENERGAGWSRNRVLVMDTLVDHPAGSIQPTANDGSQPQTIADEPDSLPPGAFLDEYTTDGEAEWDLTDNAERAWVTETICYAQSPLKGEMFP